MRTWLVVMMAILCAPAVHAPAARASAVEYPRWLFNLDGGVSSSYLQGGANAWGGNSKRTGGAFGISFELQSSETFGIDFGLNYVQKGADGDITPPPGDPYNPLPPGANVIGTTALDFVEGALMFEAVFHPGKRAEIIASVGPVLGYLTEATFDGTVDGKAQQTDLKSKLSEWAWFIAVGAGYRYDAWKNMRITLDWRVEISVSNLNDVTNSNTNVQTVSNIVTVGLGFPLTGREP